MADLVHITATDHSLLEVAVIGMACRYPGAGDVTGFWQNLRLGVESISRFSDHELRSAGVDSAALRTVGYVPAGGVVDGIDMFDAEFFGITPRMAEILDPQHRLLLECSWSALESAGYESGSYAGSIGIFAGQALSDYMRLVEANEQIASLLGRRAVLIANDKDHLTTSIAYRLNLRGPAVTVQTTCSTSLVAVHMACQSLLNAESDMALAGGVSLRIPQQTGYVPQSGLSSRDGHCRAFDAHSDGSVPSCGAGIVLLKRLATALEDGDQIHAVIKGSALSNDGSAKVGYSAPGLNGQVSAIAEALEVAEVAADAIGFVEAHGTGTPLGDPIEIAALTMAYREQTARTQYCPIGSVKTNIGHTDAAAGVAGLIKTVLALEHEAIPASLHFEEPNPEIDFAHSPFFVNASLRPWPRTDVPRYAGVSSFGMGGTNAHVIVVEAPEQRASGSASPYQLITLSAASQLALRRHAASMGAFFASHQEMCLADAAYTLRLGRRALPNRITAVCQGTEDAAVVLGSPSHERLFLRRGVDRLPVAFMFPGGSAPYEAVTSELYEWEPVFRREIDRCAELLEPEIDADIRAFLYPANPPADEERPPLQALPSIFAMEFALASLWMSWGVQPAVMIGHSLGEYVAACLAGVLSLPDALRLVAVRSRLMQAMPDGAMLSVALPEQELVPRLGRELSVAAINSPDVTVISGQADAISRFGESLIAEGISARRLRISTAAHSALLEPATEELAAFLRTLPLAPPKIPYVSGLTGNWIQAEEATDPLYWTRHLRHTVRFSNGLALLLRDPALALLEVGPGRTLTSLALRHPAKQATNQVLASLPHPGESASGLALLYSALGRLWGAGADVNWFAFRAHERRRRLELPGQPFDRRRHWIAAAPDAGERVKARPMSESGPDEAETLCHAQLKVIRKQLEILEGARDR
jgi:acyl transferase domain-containing protein